MTMQIKKTDQRDDKTSIANRKSLYPIQETDQSSNPASQKPTAISQIEYWVNAKDIVVVMDMNLTNTASEKIVNRFYVQQTLIEIIRFDGQTETEVGYFLASH